MSAPPFNAAVTALGAPPVALVQAWGRDYHGPLGSLLDLSQAVPGYPPPPELLAALAAAAGDPASLGYGAIPGEPALRDAYAAHVSERYRARISAEQVLITAGCNQAFVAAALAVAGAGSEVLLTQPCYFNHESSLRMLGIRIGVVPLTDQDQFVPRVEAVAAAITANTRALVLVTPNNPTGAIYPPALLGEMLALCRQHGIWLILDETYRDFLAPAAGSPHRLLAAPGWEQTLIQLYSFSKAYCLPGHRLGAVVAAAPVQAQLLKIMDNVQICAPRAAQQAVAPLLEPLARWREGNAVRMAGRARAFADALVAAPDWQIVSLGGYFAYVRHPWRGCEGYAVAEALARETGVLTIPGSLFGSGQSDYLRFAFANASRQALETLPARLAQLAMP
jgi:aspartate/methionine/tyrosine aminotransferase